MGERTITEEERVALGLPAPADAMKMLEGVKMDEPGEGEDDGWTAKDWGRLSLEVGGGIAGAAVGGAAGLGAGPAASLYGATVGAGLGEAAGSYASEFFDPSESPHLRAATTGAIGAAGEGVAGPLIAKGVDAMSGSKLVPGGADYIKDVDAAGLIGSIGRASKNRFYDILEGISQASFFGGARLTHAAEAVVSHFDDAVNAFAKQFKTLGSKETLEDLTRHAIEDGADAFKAAGAQKYKVVDDLIEGSIEEAYRAGAGTPSAPAALVDMGAVIAKAESMIKKGLDPSAAARLSRLLADRVGEYPGGLVPFQRAHEIRSDLLGIGRATDDLIVGKGAALGKQLSPLVDEAMEVAAKKAGKGIEEAWRAADAFWKGGLDGKGGAKLFNSSLIKALTKENPRSVFNVLKGADPREIRKVRNTIKNPELWDNIKGEYLMDMVRRATDEELGVVGGKKLSGKLRAAGDDALREVFTGKGELAAMKRLVGGLKISQGGIGKEIPGRIFIQLAQAGAAGKALGVVLGLTSTKGAMTAAGILIGPSIVSKVFTKPAFIKWATLGAKLKPGSKAAINAFSQAAAIAIAEGGRTIDMSDENHEKPPDRVRFSATAGGPRIPARGAPQ